MASRNGKRGSQESPLLVESLPGILSSLLKHKDLVEAMADVFKDGPPDELRMSRPFFVTYQTHE